MTRAKDISKILTDADISGNIDVDGVTNLDVVDIDGAVDMASTLNVTGAITSSAGATITTADNSKQLILKSTDADANVGPVLELKRDSSSPADNDYLGYVRFVGENDASEETVFAQAFVIANDVSDGTEDATFEIDSMSGGNQTQRLNLNPTETVFNEGSADLDFRVESDANANGFFLNGGTGNIGIGGDSDSAFRLSVNGDSSSHIGAIQFRNASAGGNTFTAGMFNATSTSALLNVVGAGNLVVKTNNTERLRVDSSGNLLVKKDAHNFQTAGFQVEQSSGETVATRSGGTPLVANRLTNDGEIVGLYSDSSSIGSMSVFAGRLCVGADDTALKFDAGNDSIMPFNIGTGANRDDAVDLGYPGVRFDDIFATNTSITTSDRNEKQDIEELTDAEKRVAVVAKGLMRKFRWKSRVAEKGDKARTHFGIIAQDLQDAFTAESLDATKYAMFCSDTWWEKEISVDAVEAVDEVIDEEGNLTTRAVEAKDAYTYIDIKQEATTGYTEKTRLGVRYSELLAFIISAI